MTARRLLPLLLVGALAGCGGGGSGSGQSAAQQAPPTTKATPEASTPSTNPTAAAPSPSSSRRYPAAVTRAYIRSCTATGAKSGKSHSFVVRYCTCTLAHLEKTVPVRDFLLFKRHGVPPQLRARVRAAVASCGGNPAAIP